MTFDAAKAVIVKTANDTVYFHQDFQVGQAPFQGLAPFQDFIQVTDMVTNRVYWFNRNAITWMGPNPSNV